MEDCEREARTMLAIGAYEILFRKSENDDPNDLDIVLTKDMAGILKQFIDDADFRAVALDGWSAVFGPESRGFGKNAREAWNDLTKDYLRCSPKRDGCLPTGDTPLISKN